MPEITAFQKEVPDPLTTAALRECAQVFDKAAARLEGAGITIAEYNLDGVVADVEAARKALGYSKILVSGGSYGGAVACYYSLCCSKNVRACALIEAAFPWNFGLTEPANIDAQLRRLNEEWKSKPENLALSKDIQFSISNVLARLPKEHNGVLIDPGTLRLGIFFGLYTKQQTEMILRAMRRRNGVITRTWPWRTVSGRKLSGLETPPSEINPCLAPALPHHAPSLHECGSDTTEFPRSDSWQALRNRKASPGEGGHHLFRRKDEV